MFIHFSFSQSFTIIFKILRCFLQQSRHLICANEICTYLEHMAEKVKPQLKDWDIWSESKVLVVLRSCRDFINIFPKCNDHKHWRPKKGRTILKWIQEQIGCYCVSILKMIGSYSASLISYVYLSLSWTLVTILRFVCINCFGFFKKENSNDVNRHPKNWK